MLVRGEADEIDGAGEAIEKIEYAEAEEEGRGVGTVSNKGGGSGGDEYQR